MKNRTSHTWIHNTITFESFVHDLLNFTVAFPRQIMNIRVMNKSKVVIVNLNLASGKRFFIHLELAIASAMPASNE